MVELLMWVLLNVFGTQNVDAVDQVELREAMEDYNIPSYVLDEVRPGSGQDVLSGSDVPPPPPQNNDPRD